MLGNAVYKYLSLSPDIYQIETTEHRWGTEEFKDTVTKSPANYIINCIGSIPQKKPSAEEYRSLNVDLPVFLEQTNKQIIHPSTDCEFLGKIPVGSKYSKDSIRDAEDEYGKSKATISTLIEKEFINTKIIRSSVVGHESLSAVSLLNWFLCSEGEVKGYTNHYWNGITTLEWAKRAEQIIQNWNLFPKLNQYATDENLSKYDLLITIRGIYEKDILITPFNTENDVNKCLTSDVSLPSITVQLKELKKFYKQ